MNGVLLPQSELDRLLREREEARADLMATREAHAAVNAVYDAAMERLKAEVEQLNAECQKQAELVADMHAAAMGCVCAPIRGVVEDVADLRYVMTAHASAAANLGDKNEHLREMLRRGLDLMCDEYHAKDEATGIVTCRCDECEWVREVKKLLEGR